LISDVTRTPTSFGQPDDVNHRAVGADADGVVVLLRLDVHVAGAGAETDQQDQLEDADHVALFRGAASISAGRLRGVRQRTRGR
jgi:hypothetical protein